MSDFDFKPNSHKYKEEQAEAADKKKVEKMVTGSVKTKKKNGVSKFANAFISEDTKNVKSYVVMDVLIPAIKKVVSDIVKDVTDMILYGGSGKGRGRGTSSTYVSYRNYSDRQDDNHRSSAVVRSGFDFEELIFESRGDAEAVREQLDDMIDRYKVATVADLYDAAGLTAPYTSNKYGWTNIRTAEVVRGRDGYVIKLPRAVPID